MNTVRRREPAHVASASGKRLAVRNLLFFVGHEASFLPVARSAFDFLALERPRPSTPPGSNAR
jgi:hypothetical protein